MVFRGHGWVVAFEVSPAVSASPIWVGLLREAAGLVDRTLTGRELLEGFIAEVVGAVGRRDHAPTGSREIQRWLSAYVDPLLKTVQSIEREKDGVSTLSVVDLPVEVRLGTAVLVAACLNTEVCPDVVDTLRRLPDQEGGTSAIRA
jgi:hypothetical protein